MFGQRLMAVKRCWNENHEGHWNLISMFFLFYFSAMMRGLKDVFALDVQNTKSTEPYY